MQIIDIDINNVQLHEVKNLNLCLGFFDGVHLGHVDVINQALKEGVTGVMTFDVPPHFAVGINLYNSCLTSLYDKCNLLESMGVDYVFVLRMSKKLLDLTRDEFIKTILDQIKPIKIFVGDDYSFGKKAEGTPEYLSTFYKVEIVPTKQIENRKIASRYIIELLSNGKVEKANMLLGRSYMINGLVVHGNAKGSDIGYPTANLKLNFEYVLPKVGVYAGFASLLDEKYEALICVSTHPTIMELKKPIIEVHLLSYDGNLYGKEINVSFDRFIRDVKRFENLDQLKAQIVEDVKFAKKVLK